LEATDGGIGSDRPRTRNRDDAVRPAPGRVAPRTAPPARRVRPLRDAWTAARCMSACRMNGSRIPDDSAAASGATHMHEHRRAARPGAAAGHRGTDARRTAGAAVRWAGLDARIAGARPDARLGCLARRRGWPAARADRDQRGRERRARGLAEPLHRTNL